MLLDLVDGMLGKVLVDLGDDPLLHVGVERTTQVRPRPRRRDHDERLGLALAHERFHRGGDAMSEAMLLELVPVGISYTAAEVCAGAFESAAGPVAALLVRGRIVVDEDAFGLKIRKLFVAGVEQEERLAAVADKHERVMRDLKLVHGQSPLSQKSQRDTTLKH